MKQADTGKGLRLGREGLNASRQGRKAAKKEEGKERMGVCSLRAACAHEQKLVLLRGLGARLLLFVVVLCITASPSAARADIPWSEAEARAARENAALAARPQGHDGTFFIICTLYYTPKESGFTAGRGFDDTPETRPGLRGRRYPHDFLISVKKEGFGRMVESVGGREYLRYLGGGVYGFSTSPTGSGGHLQPRVSCAMRGRPHAGLGRGAEISTESETVQEVFGSTRWKIVDTGGGLRRWQIDLYWGEDEPLGPGHLMARPRGTEFEYAYAVATVR